MVSRSLVHSRSSFSLSTRRRSAKERSRAASRDMVVGGLVGASSLARSHFSNKPPPKDRGVFPPPCGRVLSGKTLDQS